MLGIRIETDSTNKSIEIGGSEVWILSRAEYESMIKIILTPKQHETTFTKDFCGIISMKRLKEARGFYKSLKL